MWLQNDGTISQVAQSFHNKPTRSYSWTEQSLFLFHFASSKQPNLRKHSLKQDGDERWQTQRLVYLLLVPSCLPLGTILLWAMFPSSSVTYQPAQFNMLLQVCEHICGADTWHSAWALSKQSSLSVEQSHNFWFGTIYTTVNACRKFMRLTTTIL